MLKFVVLSVYINHFSNCVIRIQIVLITSFNFIIENQMNWFMNNPNIIRGNGWSLEVGKLEVHQIEE
ncbi:MAG: hypothetical protein ACOVLC_02690 [Flavobacterium sp.]